MLKRTETVTYFFVLIVVILIAILVWKVFMKNKYTIVIDSEEKLNEGIISGKNLLVKQGEYNINFTGKISDNITIKGEGGTVFYVEDASVMLIQGVRNIAFKNIKFKGLKSILIKEAEGVKFENCIFDSFTSRGIVIEDSNNIEINKSVISNIGNENIDPTWQGSGIYVNRSKNIKIHNSEIFNTYGHGGIFLIETTFKIYNNDIHDTFYRGIELYKSGNSGTIIENKIRNCGLINTTNSGIGCNGIYSNHSITNGTSEVEIIKNSISNVLENAIEGNYKKIEGNIIDGTGMDMKNHPTPSGEGIYIWGPSNLIGNNIKNTYRAGIKSYSVDIISNINIEQNIIEDCQNSKYAIDLNSEKGYSDIRILKNKFNNIENGVYLKLKPKENVVIKNNQ